MCKDDHIGYLVHEEKEEKMLQLITVIIEGGDFKTPYFWTDTRKRRIGAGFL